MVGKEKVYGGNDLSICQKEMICGHDCSFVAVMEADAPAHTV